MTNARVMNANIQKSNYRNGQLRESLLLKNGLRHGIARTWHKNGQLAVKEPYRNGLLHGLCRQWNEKGQLLGEYKMVHGTGIQRTWHDNGRLQMEISLVSGEPCGRSRVWLADGMLICDKLYLYKKSVSAQEYRAASAVDKSLPKFRGKLSEVLPDNSARQKHILRVFVHWLLKKDNHAEAREWLLNGVINKSIRSLGRFRRVSDALKFVRSLYEAGAIKVIAPDIYAGNAGDQFADSLIVQLPKDATKRNSIRKVCEQLRIRRLGAMQPDGDIGETHLYLSMT